MSSTTQITFIQAFRSVPGCQNCMCKRGIVSFMQTRQVYLELPSTKAQ